MIVTHPESPAQLTLGITPHKPRAGTMIDLFAGAGGMTAGFKAAGFDPIFAVKIDPAAARTYARNFGAHVHAGPIEDIAVFPASEIIIGGPPCQGFSPLGRDGDREAREGLNELWK